MEETPRPRSSTRSSPGRGPRSRLSISSTRSQRLPALAPPAAAWARRPCRLSGLPPKTAASYACGTGREACSTPPRRVRSHPSLGAFCTTFRTNTPSHFFGYVALLSMEVGVQQGRLSSVAGYKMRISYYPLPLAWQTDANLHGGLHTVPGVPAHTCTTVGRVAHRRWLATLPVMSRAGRVQPSLIVVYEVGRDIRYAAGPRIPNNTPRLLGSAPLGVPGSSKACAGSPGRTGRGAATPRPARLPEGLALHLRTAGSPVRILPALGGPPGPRGIREAAAPLAVPLAAPLAAPAGPELAEPRGSAGISTELIGGSRRCPGSGCRGKRPAPPLEVRAGRSYSRR